VRDAIEPKRPVPHVEVAKRAHSIWDAAGRPIGQDLAHWLRAEAELAAEAGIPEKPRRATRKATPKKAATATRKTRGRRPRPRA